MQRSVRVAAIKEWEISTNVFPYFIYQVNIKDNFHAYKFALIGAMAFLVM